MTTTQSNVSATLSDLFFNSSQTDKWDSSYEEGSNILTCAQEFLDMYPEFKNEVSATDLREDFLGRV